MGAELKRLEGQEALKSAAPLFANWQETLIWSALEGRMGGVYVLAQAGRPAAALCACADFVFLSGTDVGEARRLLEAWKRMNGGGFAILAVRPKKLEQLAEEAFGAEARRTRRYAFEKSNGGFDRERLQALAGQLPEGVSLRPFDGALYKLAMRLPWARDFCGQFRNERDFLTRGLGVAALKDGELVGGASSYTVYSGGVEIQVETRRDMYRQGIATACCAKLILQCLARGWHPSWDAANAASAGLAKKLGYRESGSYTAWELYHPALEERMKPAPQEGGLGTPVPVLGGE